VLKTMLVQCAWAAKRAKDSYYLAQYHRLPSRRGPQKAICAVATSLLTAIYNTLKSGAPHRGVGADYFDRRSPCRMILETNSHATASARSTKDPSPCRKFLVEEVCAARVSKHARG
jgi:hypothetical protein